MSLKPNGSGNAPSNSIAKDAGIPGDAKAPDHSIGDAMERLQSMFPSEPTAEPGKSGYMAKTADGNLIAGAGVKFKGEIAACHTLTVEGKIDVNVRARKIIVTDGGSIVGKADVGEAEIAGHFDGALRVSGKLTIRRTGHINGTISYGQLEIEPGGELRGRVDVEAKKSDGAAEKSWAWRS